MRLRRLLAPALFLAAWLVYIGSLMGTSWKMADQKLPASAWEVEEPLLEITASEDEPIRRLLIDLSLRGSEEALADPLMQECLRERKGRVLEVPLHFSQQGPWQLEHARHTHKDHTFESFRDGDLLVIRRQPLTSLRACQSWYAGLSLKTLVVPTSITHVRGVHANLVVAATGTAPLEELTLDADAVTIRADRRANTPFLPIRIGRLNLLRDDLRDESNRSEGNDPTEEAYETPWQTRTYAVMNGEIDQLHIVASSGDRIDLMQVEQVRHIHLAAPPSVELHLGRADTMDRIQWEWLEESFNGNIRALELECEA